MIKRAPLLHLISRMKEPRRFIQVVMGPRQVGKTTMVLQVKQAVKFPNEYHSADDELHADSNWLRLIWSSARQKMRTSKSRNYLLIIDEIQKIHNWSETVKALWDEDTRSGVNLKILVLGSSRMLLQTGLTESLAGRFENTYVGHWTYSEMKEAFGWGAEKYAWFGGYPGSVALIKDEDRWRNYVRESLLEASVWKDILMLSRVDKPALMRRLFELGSSYSGQILSFNKILGQLQDAGNTTTLSHYLELLDSAGLLGGLGKYASDKARQRSSSPKFQVHNPAIYSARINRSFKEVRADHSAWGRVVESAVGAHLLNSSISEGFTVWYWRHRNEEVDFILEKKGKVIALEVKSNSKAVRTGMEAFRKQFKTDKTLLIGDAGIKWQDLLAMKVSDLW